MTTWYMTCSIRMHTSAFGNWRKSCPYAVVLWRIWCDWTRQPLETVWKRGKVELNGIESSFGFKSIVFALFIGLRLYYMHVALSLWLCLCVFLSNMHKVYLDNFNQRDNNFHFSINYSNVHFLDYIQPKPLKMCLCVRGIVPFHSRNEWESETNRKKIDRMTKKTKLCDE